MIHQTQFALKNIHPIYRMFIPFSYFYYQNEKSKVATEHINNVKKNFTNIIHRFRNALVNKFHDQNGVLLGQVSKISFYIWYYLQRLFLYHVSIANFSCILSHK